MNSNFEQTELDTKKVKTGGKVPVSARWRSWRVNIFVYMLIGLILFFGSCQAAQMAGWWSTTGRTAISQETIPANGVDTSSVRGSTTIKQVLTDFNISWEEFSQQFNLPADTNLDSQLKTLESISPDFSVSTLRTWLSERAK